MHRMIWFSAENSRGAIAKTWGTMVFIAAFTIHSPVLGKIVTSEEEEYRVKVRVDDLNLARLKDARIMVDRIEEAALLACGGSSFSALEYKRVIRSSDCYRQSVGRAVAELKSDLVSRLAREVD